MTTTSEPLPAPLERARAATVAARDADKAVQTRDRLIRKAYGDGTRFSLATIAAAVGLSKPRIHQIVHRRS